MPHTLSIRAAKRFFEMFFALALLLSAAARAETPPVQELRVVVYGDSVISGHQLKPEESFPVKLDRKLKEVGFQGVRVISLSIAGETTAGGVERVSSVVLAKPDIAIIALGSNDVRGGTDPDTIYKNLMSIVERLVRENVYVVLAGARAPVNFGYTYTKQIEAIYDRVASYYRVAYYPNILDGVAGEPAMLLSDGYHPNAAGIDRMVEGLYRYVDAGLRWKIQVLQYQHDYQQQIQNDPSIAQVPPPPVSAEPAPMALPGGR